MIAFGSAQRNVIRLQKGIGWQYNRLVHQVRNEVAPNQMTRTIHGRYRPSASPIALRR